MDSAAADANQIMETPLAGLHARMGAHLGSWFGCFLPDDFGDAAIEFFHAHDSVALIDKNYRAYLSFTGPDRVRYLNAILTNNVKDLRLSHGVISLLLNPQGHILGEIETYSLPDHLFCVSYASIRSRLVETLDKFIIMDDVTLSDDTDRYGTLAVEGPAAARHILDWTGVDLDRVDDLSRVDAVVDSIACVLVKRSFPGYAGGEFLVPRENLERLWRALESRISAAGGGPVGYSALSALRLEQGVPWFSYDFGEKQIPHEAGLQDSHISYTKGCYTGQEIVERVRSRGQVNRRRIDLVFSSKTAPDAGTPLMVAGKEVGYVTRAAAPANFPFAIGMGYVRKDHNSPGSILEWAGGTARVAQFPEEFAKAS